MYPYITDHDHNNHHLKIGQGSYFELNYKMRIYAFYIGLRAHEVKG